MNLNLISEEKLIGLIDFLTNNVESNIPAWSCVTIISFLTHLEFSEEESKNHFLKICEHRREISYLLRRDVGFIVAALDYFHNLANLLKKPIIIELSSFEAISRKNTEDFIGRFGGNEFVVLLPQTGRTGARCLAKRMKIDIKNGINNVRCKTEGFKIGFSMGIAVFPYDGNDYEKLISSADISLNKAKKLGNNRIYDSFEKVIDNNFKERRKHQRFEIKYGNITEVENETGPMFIQGKLVNIGPGGLLLEYDCKED